MSHIINKNSIRKVYKNINTSVTAQIGSLTYTDVLGSTASYTPHKSASYVVYEFIFVSHSNSSNHHNLYTALVYDTGGSETAYEYVSISDGYNDGHYAIKAKFLIPSYSGSRNWKLKFRSSNGANWFPKLHEDEDGNVFYPTLLIYSII